MVQGKKAFKERFFVLWRHPNLVSGDYTLFWYESETDQVPKGHQALPVGMYSVNMPKSRRKGYDFCFRIDMKNTGDAEGRKFILAARSDDPQGEEKMKIWKDSLAKIETDAKAELAAETAKANKKAKPGALDKVRSVCSCCARLLRCTCECLRCSFALRVWFGDSAMRTQSAEQAGRAEEAAAAREKQLQDHITAGIIEAGIISCVMAQPVCFTSCSYARAQFSCGSDPLTIRSHVRYRRRLLWSPLLCAPVGCARKAKATRLSNADFSCCGAPRRRCSEQEKAWKASGTPPQTTTCWSTTRALVSVCPASLCFCLPSILMVAPSSP